MTLQDKIAIVEIADTSLGYDLGRKLRFYATIGLAEYWVFDLNQLWSPGGDGYAERREVAFGEQIEAATIAELGVDTARI